MRGLEKNRMGRGQHIHGHRDSMIESAQWADSMKTLRHFTEGGGGLLGAFRIPGTLESPPGRHHSALLMGDTKKYLGQWRTGQKDTGDTGDTGGHWKPLPRDTYCGPGAHRLVLLLNCAREEHSDIQ